MLTWKKELYTVCFHLDIFLVFVFLYNFIYFEDYQKEFPIPLPSVNSGSVWINILVADIDLWSYWSISWCTCCMRNHRGASTFLCQGLLVAVCSLYMVCFVLCQGLLVIIYSLYIVYFVLFFLQNFSHYLWFFWQKFLFVSWGLDFLFSYTIIHWALS